MSAALARRYGGPGEEAAGVLAEWLSGRVFGAEPNALIRYLAVSDAAAVYDHFWRPLPLGTGGRRGPVGFGPNRINRATVAVTVQGHCDYLHARYGRAGPRAVVVANDVREFHDLAGNYRALGPNNPLLGLSSRVLARLAGQIYAANGITAYLVDPDDPKATLTTPELSYAIRHLRALGGVNLSASHNPPDDNGIKVYDASGGQFAAPEDDVFATRVTAAGPIAPLDFVEARAAGLIRPLPDEVTGGYREIYRRQYERRRGVAPRATDVVVFTPLNGCGERTVETVLRDLGFNVAVPEEHRADGTFAAIPFRAPNPEVAAATKGVHTFADRRGATLVLSSDPDADRVGADVKLDDEWWHLDGNQIASVLAGYLLTDPDGPQLRGLVVETLVTTRLVGSIARSAGVPLVDDLLVGFKYVSRLLEQRGTRTDDMAEPLVLAVEESHGVLTTAELRDKDAVSGAVYLAHLHLLLARRGSNLVEYYAGLLRAHGPHATASRSIVLRGQAGAADIAALMRSLRDDPPAIGDPAGVTETLDYWQTERWGAFAGISDRQSRDVIQWRTPDLTVTVRPSGTEPKIKIYVEWHPGGTVDTTAYRDLVTEVTEQALRSARAVYRLMIERLGRSLSEPAVDLPDLIDLIEKERFDQEVVPGLRARLATPGADVAAVRTWLAETTATFLPGADPLPALRAALARLHAAWAADGSRADALAELLRHLYPYEPGLR